MGVGTRTEVKRAISKGRVSVDGACVKKPETKIDTEETTVVFDGQTVGYTKKEYYMLHKPAGVISATEDAREKTVIDLIVSRKRKDLFPVGRLDKDTEGLLLITNDGELAHRLLSPKKHVDKTYYAKVQGIVTQEDVRKFAEGVDIHEKKLTAPAVLEVVKSGEVSEILLTICEGKFHQVKRMFEAVGKKVIYLKRLSMGPDLFKEIPSDPAARIRQGIGGKKLHRDRTVFSGCISRALLFAGRCAKGVDRYDTASVSDPSGAKAGGKRISGIFKTGADPDGNCYEQCKGAGSCRSGRAADPGVFFFCTHRM